MTDCHRDGITKREGKAASTEPPAGWRNTDHIGIIVLFGAGFSRPGAGSQRKAEVRRRLAAKRRRVAAERQPSGSRAPPSGGRAPPSDGRAPPSDGRALPSERRGTSAATVTHRPRGVISAPGCTNAQQCIDNGSCQPCPGIGAIQGEGGCVNRGNQVKPQQGESGA